MQRMQSPTRASSANAWWPPAPPSLPSTPRPDDAHLPHQEDREGGDSHGRQPAITLPRSSSSSAINVHLLSASQPAPLRRDNVLTRVLQDSLGGDAKTLMIACLSPVEYNADETISTLAYAARVKLIKNTAKKDEDSAEVTRLKKIIKRLKAGEAVSEEEEAGEMDAGEGGAAAAAAASS